MDCAARACENHSQSALKEKKSRVAAKRRSAGLRVLQVCERLTQLLRFLTKGAPAIASTPESVRCACNLRVRRPPLGRASRCGLSGERAHATGVPLWQGESQNGFRSFAGPSCALGSTTRRRISASWLVIVDMVRSMPEKRANGKVFACARQPIRSQRFTSDCFLNSLASS